MDAIKKFEIQLDISKCSCLYDYIREERYERPETGWDLYYIIAAAKRKPRDMTGFTNKLRKAHMDKGFFEKVKSNAVVDQQSILNEFHNPDASQTFLPGWLLPFFEPGDIVKGEVYLEVTEEVKAENIKLDFLGAARTMIEVQTDKGKRQSYGSEIYVEESVLLWMRTGSDPDKKAIYSPSMLTGEVISPGYMKIPFEFQLPRNGQPSLPSLVQHSFYDDYAHITYFMKATINAGKMLRRGNIVCHQPLWVRIPKQLSQNPDDLTTVSLQQTKKLGRNNVYCTVSIPKKVFFIGEDVHLTVNIENMSTVTINNVIGCVQIVGVYRPDPCWGCFCCPRDISFKSPECKSGKINAGDTRNFRMDLPMKLNTRVDLTLMPANPPESQIIVLEYQVHVKVKFSGMHSDMIINVPFELGSRESTSVVDPGF